MSESLSGGKERDRVFEIYEEAMKNIDEKLKESKRMFPDEIWIIYLCNIDNWSLSLNFIDRHLHLHIIQIIVA